MISSKQIIRALGLLALNLALLVGSGGYGQIQTQPATDIALNAFGSCPDAFKDHFMKSTGRPPTFEVPASLDLIRAQIRRELDPFGQEIVSFEAETLELIPAQIRNVQSVFFFAVDVDGNNRTGQPEPTFDLGMELSMVAQYNRGFSPRFFGLIWPTRGGSSISLNVTQSVALEGRLLKLQVPLATLNAQYLAVYGSPIPLDNPELRWGVYTGFWRESTAEDPAFDVFPERATKVTLPRPRAELVNQELLWQPKEDVTPQQAEGIIAQLGTQIIRFFELFRIYHLKIIDGTDVFTKIKQFLALRETLVAEINGVWCLAGENLSPTPSPLGKGTEGLGQQGAGVRSALPDDPGFAMQWNLSNQGQSHPVARGTEARGRSGSDIGIMRAWDAGRTDSSSVLIGVIDSGGDLTHPDLASNLRLELSYDFIQNDATPEDNIGHGTFVSSLIGAIGNNGADLSGVSWKAALMPLKATDKLSLFQKVMRLIGGITWDNFLQAMERAITLRLEGRNLRVINFSAGGPLKSDLLDKVIRLAGERGILFVTAAGNDGRNVETNPIYPCAYNEANMICVAASTDEDKLASFSNFSEKLVHLAAPGADVVGLIPTALKVESETLIGNAESRRLTSGVAVGNGTSFAVPHVTGIAALLFANCPATITVADIKKAILDAAERKPELSGKVVTGSRLRWPEKLPAGCQK